MERQVGADDVGGPVAEQQECQARQVVGELEEVCDVGQVEAQELRGGQADGDEARDELYYDERENEPGLYGVCRVAVVQFEVVDKA